MSHPGHYLVGVLEDHLRTNDWIDLAACADEDPKLFFPPTGTSAEPAKRICARCPVRSECLEYALRHRERHGIWGATSDRDRRKVRYERMLNP